VEEKNSGIRRRGLLTAAGITAAAGLTLGGAILARPAKPAGRVHNRAWWIRKVKRPTLGEKNAVFQRFSGNNIFEIYQSLKCAREGAGAFKSEQAEKRTRLADWMIRRQPGFSLRDHQLSEGAWTLMHSTKPGEGLLSWRRVAVRTPIELGTAPYSATPVEAAETVKVAARFYGAGLAGIAPLNEQYVNLRESGKDVVFEDVDLPEVADEKFVIPRRMKWVIALAIPMDVESLSLSPTAVGDAATGLGYSQSAFVVASLAEFIRGLGYQAIPSINDTALSVPIAMEAGLGELSRLNKLVTPEFGPAVRLCKVFTDLPMACDQPVDFGLVEFCKRCKKCAESCPARALSFDDEPSFKTRGPWNNPGHKAWFEDSYKCYEHWQSVGTGCGVCLASCPFTKAADAWGNEAAKATISIAPATGGLFRVLDDTAGFGEPKDPERWWV
jgi:reductive dehalogenase